MPQHWTLAIDRCPRQQYNIGNYSVSGALASEVALSYDLAACPDLPRRLNSERADVRSNVDNNITFFNIEDAFI